MERVYLLYVNGCGFLAKDGSYSNSILDEGAMYFDTQESANEYRSSFIKDHDEPVSILEWM